MNYLCRCSVCCWHRVCAWQLGKHPGQRSPWRQQLATDHQFCQINHWRLDCCTGRH